MRLRVERTVPFPRDDVYAWWTDFREDDHDDPESPAWSVREIVERDSREILLRERATRPVSVTIEERVVLNPPKGYTVAAKYPGADARYTYRFEPDVVGTRVVLEAEIRPRNVGHVVLPFLRRWARRYAERDTDFHIRRMTRDLTSRASDPGPLR